MTNETKILLKKMLILAITMLVVTKLVVFVFSKHYVFSYDDNEERCIPEYSFYLVQKNPTEIERGKIYMFKAQNLEPFFDDGTYIGKYALAVENDVVEITSEGVFVNNELKLSGFPLVDKLSIKESSLYKKFVVPTGKIFFAGTGERSFDSRYWGLASFDQVIGRAIPLW